MSRDGSSPRSRAARLLGGSHPEPVRHAPAPEAAVALVAPGSPAPLGTLATGPRDARTDADVRLVYGWLRRCRIDAAEAERLTVEVLRRAREPLPVALAAAAASTKLQYLVAQAVLRARGVL